MKAPNGKPSNLTPEQWKLVRTPQFKAWFGDWENDPESASKVVDENGEPLVVYHGTQFGGFSEFEKSKIGRNYERQPFGFYFTNIKTPKQLKGYSAEEYANKKGVGNKPHIFEVFLNVKNPIIQEVYSERPSASIDYEYNELKTALRKSYYTSNKKDGVIAESKWSKVKEIIIVVLESNQIKLADGSNTTFDGSNPDIRFAEGGTTNYGIDELYEIANQKFESNGYEVTQGSNSKTDYGHSRYFYVNQNDVAKDNSGLGFQVRVSDHSTGDRRILNAEQFIFNESDIEVVYNRINYWFHPEEYKNVVVVKNKVVQIEVGENDLQPSDSIISERVAKSGSTRYTIKRTYKNEGIVPTHVESGFKLPFKPNNPDIRFAEGGKTKRYMKKIKRGGITYGKSHAEGGIPVKNQSTGDMLEVEGGEGIVNKRSMASDKMVKLNGKEMTICEAVSQLNQLEGGVQFSCDDVSDRQFIEAMAKGGELERGVRTEQEHIQVLKDLYAKRITPKQASKRIAKDHLKEDSRYYSKLAKMEGKMAKGGKVKNDYNVPSTEDLVDMVANAREKQIKKVKQSGVPIVIGRNDGYYFKTSDSANYSEQILSSRPSKRKVIEIIESNPNITEVYFQGSIRGGDYIGDVDFDIIDDFVVTLWKKPIDVSNAIGTTFQWTETEQDPKNEKKEIKVDPRIYILVKQEDAHIYKDRPTDDKYFYLNSYFEKNGEQSSIRIPKSDFQHLIEEGELETIEVSQALKEQLLKPMKTYAKGGEIFDKETEDFLSDLTKKYAKGGEVVADKTETINMKDFEGYADQYNGRKNKFFKANDEYQLLVNEGMELKNNTTLPQEEKDKLLAELREKAREAKTNLGEKRKDLVDMREVKSPFYAPQLAKGGMTAKQRIDKGEGGMYKIKAKHPSFPLKGIDVYLNIDSQSMRGVMSFTIGTRNLDVLYPKEVIIDVLEKTGLKSSSFQVFGTKEAKSLKVSIDFNFRITSDNFSYLSMEILKALTSNKYYESILDGKKEETTPPPPTEKEDDWNWRFKTEQELKNEYGWERIQDRIKNGNLFATNMFFLLGKKINETQEAVEAISKINQNTYGGVETFIQKQLGIETPTKDSSEHWSISNWMITDKPLEGEEVPPTEEKKKISEKDVQNEVFRWCEEKAKEKKDINGRKYQISNLIDWIFLNQNGGSMVQFSELIAMAKQSEKLQKELGRLANDEGLPIDGFVMQLLYKKIIQSVEEIKSQIMLFVLFESEVREQLDMLVFHIPYLAELDTFDKDYIIHIK